MPTCRKCHVTYIKDHLCELAPETPEPKKAKGMQTPVMRQIGVAKKVRQYGQPQPVQQKG